MLKPALLGAALYMPATHPKLEQAFAGCAGSAPSAVIACTEDAVAEGDVETALQHLASTLLHLPAKATRPLRFVRVRNTEVLRQLIAMPGSERLHGIVIPKADQTSLPAYLRLLAATDWLIMPTIETLDAFDPAAMRALRKQLLAPTVRPRCLALRFGGNDLFSLLGMRRPRDCTLYDTPLGTLVGQLVLTFRPHGIAMTGPVFEYFDTPHLLEAEARQDRQMGLVGKSAVHPDQVALIESAFGVSQRDRATATAVIEQGAKAVFKFDGAMIEPAVHRQWALATLRQRSEEA